MTDELDASLARLRRAVDDREARRRAPAVEPFQADASPHEPAPLFTGPTTPPHRAFEPQQSWTDMLRRLLGR